MQAQRPLPANVQAAISAFLNQCQNEATPFAGTEALGAIRMMFPGLDISDADLEDAISNEAAKAGFDVGYEPALDCQVKSKSLQRWENEGDAAKKILPTKAPRRIDNDTIGAKRRATTLKIGIS